MIRGGKSFIAPLAWSSASPSRKRAGKDAGIGVPHYRTDLTDLKPGDSKQLSSIFAARFI